jgi:hypothetical protein
MKIVIIVSFNFFAGRVLFGFLKAFKGVFGTLFRFNKGSKYYDIQEVYFYEILSILR